MTEANVLLWNADCSPALDEDGNQVFVQGNLVVLVKDANGNVMLDSCGHEIWDWKPVPTTQPPVTTRPPIIVPPPIFGINKVPWKLLGIVVVVFVILGWLFR